VLRHGYGSKFNRGERRVTSKEYAAAHERLNKAFTPHRPIDLPEFFSGREDLLYRVSDAANTAGLHIILFGDRGTGKTSIARVLARTIQEPERPDGRRAILVSCTSTDDYMSIWRKVLREIQVAQRQLGFVQHTVAEVVGRLDVNDTLQDPNDIRLFVQSLPNPSLIVMDEFDRVPQGSDARRLMADTIKLFSDTDVQSTLVIVGVAESISELITEHESISRNVAQILVEPMTVDELSEIIQKGFKRAQLDYEAGVDRRIANLSQGYPHYTHLLGLWSGRHAVENHRNRVTIDDLSRAIPDALRNAAGAVQQEYEQAVSSSRGKTLYKEVLLACALAQKDSLGRFSAIHVRQPLRQITNQNYDTGAFQGHLAKFCERDRGPVLKRTGKRRSYRWQFVNPQLIPYVLLEGIRNGLIAPLSLEFDRILQGGRKAKVRLRGQIRPDLSKS
jgi:Cdc6-like AAA superfamily ATPase